ncbi:MAG TPA: hypothetical protein VFM02_04205 [Candidatus Paceibacterota bacterium]|nr:hypothetical protein [Candidatus Paceibacterota bacterium]
MEIKNFVPILAALLILAGSMHAVSFNEKMLSSEYATNELMRHMAVDLQEVHSKKDFESWVSRFGLPFLDVFRNSHGELTRQSLEKKLQSYDLEKTLNTARYALALDGAIKNLKKGSGGEILPERFALRMIFLEIGGAAAKEVKRKNSFEEI